MTTPPLLKHLSPYLKHAQQLQAQDPLMAYYCKYYFIQEGIKLRSSAPSDNELKKFLLMMMDQLEEQKKTLGTLDELEGEVHVKDFAMHVFNLADEEDRNGAANKNTAMNFYAASQFFDVLKLFGELSQDVIEKQKYAKWKAANINSCLKKGIQPKPGPPTQENEQRTNSDSVPPQQSQVPEANHSLMFPNVPNMASMPSVPNFGSSNVPTFSSEPKSTQTTQQPHTPPMPTFSSSATNSAAPPALIKQAPPQNPAPSATHHIPSSGSFTPSYQDIELATKHAKFAVSSLQFEDVPSAVKFLKLALKNLTNVEY